MTIRTLATHIAELPDWILFTLNSHELDFAKHPYDPLVINSTEKLMETFEKSFANGKEALATTTEAELEKNWVLRNGCLLYTSDAADERSSVDLGGRRIIKKKK